MNDTKLRATTILCLRKNNEVVIAGDGQASFGSTVFKANVNKVRKLKGDILTGFSGSTADAFTLFERLEQKLEKYSGKLVRSCVELAKDWRSDKYLRKLEAMIIAADKDNILVISGSGDVLEPDDNVAAIGSGGSYALAAARALLSLDNDLTAEEIAKRAMNIAGEICIYSNNNINYEKITK